jgi:chromosome partitioning protein
MKKLISFVNLKGGVGKTTSSVNVGAIWAKKGYKTLLIDLDPQGSATHYLGIDDSGEELLLALQRTSSLPFISLSIDNFFLVPSGRKLSEAISRFPIEYGIEIIERSIQRTEGDWDVVLIDCPPSISVLTYGALKASSVIVVPVEANFLGLKGLEALMALLADIKKKDIKKVIDAVIPCRAHPRRLSHKKVMQELKNLFPDKITPPVRESASLISSVESKLPVVIYNPRSTGALDYIEIATWLERIL